MFMKKIVLCGGGTAGHVTPNLALIPFLRKSFDEIHYIGSRGGIEKSLVENEVDYYHEIECVKLIRSLSPKNLLIPYRLIKSVTTAKKLLAEIEPDIIFSKGGFASLPVCLASRQTPLVLHESDFSLGLANKLAVRKCLLLLTAFPLEHKKALAVGSPLRQEIYNGNAEKARTECRLFSPLPYLLVVGGSSGATAINDAVIKNLDLLCSKFNIIHITGKNKCEQITRKNYFQTQFTSDIQDYFALADFVVSRGGANTLFELVSLKKPSLIIPLPKSGTSRGDQEDNARYFSSLGAIKVLEQTHIGDLPSALDDLTKSKTNLIDGMTKLKSVDGTKKIIEILTQYA